MLTLLIALATANPGVPAAPAAAAPTADNDKIICRQSDADTGSRISVTRICKRKSEWRQADVETQRGLRTIDERNIDVPALQRGGGAGAPVLPPRG